jgi:prepilin-type N-terminal cleavage/methylation domain-containing protein
MGELKNKNGFTLIEILVSMALFIIIITAALNIFKLVIDSQRSAIATQNVEESLKYFLEVTGKEIRMAKRNVDGTCNLPVTDIYKTTISDATTDTLTFKNYHDQCVTYTLTTQTDGTKRFSITRAGVPGFITPAKISIDELHFIVRPEGGVNNSQPTVTMELLAHAPGKDSAKSEMRLQTTLTSRYYLKN